MKEETYEVRVPIDVEVLRGAFDEQIYEIENKIPTFVTIPLLWHLKRYQGSN